MAAPKKPAPSPKRERTVPVRIVKSVRSARPVQEPATTPAPAGQQQDRPFRPMSNKRKLMWAGVIIVSTIILVLWVGYMQQTLTASSNSNDSFFTKIGHDLKDAFSKFRWPGSNAENTNERELNELRNSVFPEIKVQDSTTSTATNGNTNVTTNMNTNQNVNGNANTNVNSTTNAATL